MPKGNDLSASAGRKPTCVSCQSAGYWFLVALIAWGVIALAGLAWPPLHGGGGAALFLAAGVGCVANWNRNRTYHCAITGPLLFLAAFALLAINLGWAHLSQTAVVAPLVIGVAVACLLEQRFAGHAATR